MITAKEEKVEKPKERQEIEFGKAKLSVVETIKAMREAGTEDYLPITLPLETAPAAKLEHVLAGEDSKLVLMQFPRLIPFNLEKQNNFLEEEKLQDSAYLDEEALKDQIMSKKDFPNMFKALGKSCQIGSLQVMKNGKIRMKIGNNYFSVDKGAESTFFQEAKAIYKAKECHSLGQVDSQKAVITPILD